MWRFNRMKETEKINLVDLFTSNLGMNSSAKLLFEKLNSDETNCFELDFEGVKFMSMTFTQEYLYQKCRSDKKISEINLSDEVSQTLNLVSKRMKIKDC